MAGFDPFCFAEEQFTTPKVTEEIRVESMISLRFKTAIENGKVQIKVPSEESLKEIRKVAATVGDVHLLSETDIQVLALALESKNAGNPEIVTDDYSIQNVASKLGLEFISLATFGISRVLKWIRYCPACYRLCPHDFKGKTCMVCGTSLKRKPERPKTKH